MGVTIVWFSRHLPTPRQRQELKRLFGKDVRVRVDKRPFDSAEAVVKRYNKSGATEMVIVAPFTVIRQLNLLGLHPLWAEMQACPSTHPECEVHISNRHYRFVGFKRITVNLSLETVVPSRPREQNQ